MDVVLVGRGQPYRMRRGHPIFWNSLGQLRSVDLADMAGTNVIVGPFVNASQMTDIALDNTGGLFGVAFDQGGSFWSINPRTGRATLAATSYSGHDIDGGLGGLASYGPGLFYASSNSGGSMPFLVEIANGSMGSRHLAGLSELTQLDLAQCPHITDDGLTVLREFPKLTRFCIQHQNKITDRGIAHLSDHQHLQVVDLLGTNTGDGAVRALTDNPDLDHLLVGNEITDAGLYHLHDFPAFKDWRGEQPQVDILCDDTHVTTLMINLVSKVSDRGLANLIGLDGLGYVKRIGSPEPGPFDSRGNPITAEGIRQLANLPHLNCFGGSANNGNDEDMAMFADFPDLHYLSNQCASATDAGFRALATTKSLMHLFATDCRNISVQTLEAFSSMSSLRAVALGGPNVPDEQLDVLEKFQQLRQLIPVGVGEKRFAAIGKLAGLEILDCMFCRDVTDRGIEQIAGLTNLRRFRIWGTEINDAALEALSRVSGIEDLHFEGCGRITDRGVKHLATLPRLRVINLHECVNVSRESVRLFEPQVRVEWLP